MWDGKKGKKQKLRKRERMKMTTIISNGRRIQGSETWPIKAMGSDKQEKRRRC